MNQHRNQEQVAWRNFFCCLERFQGAKAAAGKVFISLSDPILQRCSASFYQKTSLILVVTRVYGQDIGLSVCVCLSLEISLSLSFLFLFLWFWRSNPGYIPSPWLFLLDKVLPLLPLAKMSNKYEYLYKPFSFPLALENFWKTV